MLQKLVLKPQRYVYVNIVSYTNECPDKPVRGSRCGQNDQNDVVQKSLLDSLT